MSSPPSDRGATSGEALFEGDPDADTGPVFVVGPNGQETAAAPTYFPGQADAGNWGQGDYPPEQDHAIRTQFWPGDATPRPVTPTPPPNSRWPPRFQPRTASQAASPLR